MTGIVTLAAARWTAATLAALLIWSAATPVSAGNAYWYGTRSNSWNDGIVGNSSNWYAKNGMTLRDPPSDTAVFTQSRQKNTVTFTQNITTVKAILFLKQAGVFQFFLGNQQLQKQVLEITGDGIRNKDTNQVAFFVRFKSRLLFTGGAVIDDPGPVMIVNAETARTLFTGKSNGGAGVVQNLGIGRILFSDRASAGRMHITNFDRDTQTIFTGRSTGGSATVSNDRGRLQFATHPSKRPTIGKVFNRGYMELRPGVHLTVRRLLNLHQQGFPPTGYLRIWMPGETPKPRINVLRHARLGGDLSITNVRPSRALPKGNYVLIKAASRVGQFARVFFTGRFVGTPSIFYRGTDVVLRVR
jgi:hypothetical protein